MPPQNISQGLPRTLYSGMLMTQPTVPPAPHADLRAARGQATRARLLAEALRLFAERGYEGVSTRAVALAAESNVALIAFHFGSKRGLYEAAVEAVARRTAEAIAPAEENLRRGIAELADRREDLLALLRSEVQEFLARLLPEERTPGFFPLLTREMHEQGELSVRLWNILLPALRTVEELLVAGSSPEQRPRARTAAFLLIDSMMGIVRDYDIFRRHMDGGQNSAQDAALLAELLCRGIEPGFAAPSSGKACFNPQSPHPPAD